ISLDRAVLPEATSDSAGAVDVVATVVPTAGSANAVLRWRGSETCGDLPRTPEWQCLGYDVCDEVGTSGLMNCGYEPGERRLADEFAERVNDWHLFDTVSDADDFRKLCDQRLCEHQPFAV